MNVHTTEIGTWKRCRRQWYWTSPNSENREPRAYHGALALGTLIHEALDFWITNPDGDPVTFFYTAAHSAKDGIRVAYLNRVGAPMSEMEIQPIEKDIELGYAMLSNYVAYYRTPLPKGWTVVATEQEFSIPLAHNLNLCGRMDLILSDPLDRLYVGDHKTFATHPSEEYIQENEQFRRYTMALKYLYPNAQTMGFFYNGLWKRGHIPKGRTMDDLFMRRMLHFNDISLEEMWNDTITVLEQIEKEGVYAVASPNRTWTCAIDCTSAIRSLCTAQSHGDDVSVLKDRLTRVKTKGEAQEQESVALGLA